MGAINDKYDFDDEVIQLISDHTYFDFQPRVIIANTLIVVNGSLRLNGATLLTQKTILFRCSDDDIVRDDILVLQDDDVYDPLPNSQHYKKKILFDHYRDQPKCNSNTAMFYLTSVCRNYDVRSIMDKYNYEYIALSDINIEGIKTHIVPVSNMWELFNTFIYTQTSKKFDCSPRFIAECKYYNKEVIYEHGYEDVGLNVRIADINKGLEYVSLQAGDAITSWI